jgi:hypothetical protein
MTDHLESVLLQCLSNDKTEREKAEEILVNLKSTKSSFSLSRLFHQFDLYLTDRKPKG